MRLADPVRMEALQEDRSLVAATREQPRDDLLVEHAMQLARNAWREKEARLADVVREPAGRTDRIVEHLRTRREHRLLAVARWHDASPALEEILHLGEPALVEHELHAGGLCRDLLRKIVYRRTQTAVHD